MSDTETLTITQHGDFFEITVIHDQSGSSCGITISKGIYDQLREYFHEVEEGEHKTLQDLLDRLQKASDTRNPTRKWTPAFRSTIESHWKGKEKELLERITLLESEIRSEL